MRKYEKRKSPIAPKNDRPAYFRWYYLNITKPELQAMRKEAEFAKKMKSMSEKEWNKLMQES